MRIGYDAKRIFHNQTGLGNYGRDIVRILTESEHMEQLILFNTKRSRLEERVTLGKSTIVYPKGWFWEKFPSLWRLLGQWKQIEATNLDGFHGLSGEIPVQFQKKHTPKIVTIHDLIFLSHPHYYNIWDRIIYTLKFRYAAKTADYIIAISEQTKKDIIKFFHIDPDKIKVIYQGCHKVFKKVYTEQEKLDVQKKYGLPDNYIINVGTLQERKNVLQLIKAVRGTHHHLVLIGKEKSYAKKLYRYVEAHKMEGQVSFLKNIGLHELPILYQKAAVFCYPSICEGFGIPIIEAMFSKIPVVVTKGGCFPEAAGPNSLYIDPNNPNDIRDKLNWIFAHPEESREIAEKGYAHVQQFSDKNVAENLLALYKLLK